MRSVSKPLTDAVNIHMLRHTSFSISCSRILSSLCQRWYSSRSSSLSLTSEMLFLRSRVRGWTCRGSLGFFLWLRGLVRGDTPVWELRAGVRPPFCLPPGWSFKRADTGDGLLVCNLVFPTSSSAVARRWKRGLSVTVRPREVKECPVELQEELALQGHIYVLWTGWEEEVHACWMVLHHDEMTGDCLEERVHVNGAEDWKKFLGLMSQHWIWG